MKKILTILFVLCSVIAFGQYPKQLNAYNPLTQVNFLGGIGIDSSLAFLYNYPDTVAVNRGFIKNIPNAIVLVDDTLRKRSNDATRWDKLGGGGGITPATLTISSPLTGTSYDGTTPVTIGITLSDATHNGYLSSTDWNTFNNKQPAGSYLTAVTSNSPLSGSGTSGSHLIVDTTIVATRAYVDNLVPLTIYTGDGSLPTNREVNLNGHNLSFRDVTNNGRISVQFLSVLNQEQINMVAANQTGDGNVAKQYLQTTDVLATAIWQANFNDGVKLSDITMYADASESEVTYTADTHTFNGTVDLSDISHSGNINYTATAHLFTGTMTLLGLAGNGVGIASVGNDGSLGWSTGNANLLVDSIGTVGQAIVVPRGDTLYHRLFRAGLYTTVDTASTGEVRSNIDTASSGLHTLIALYGSVTMAAVGASPNANGATVSSGVLTLQPASASFPGVVTTGTQPIAGQKTFSSAFFPTGGVFTNTTAITSNFAANGGGAGTASTNATLAIKGDGTVGDRVLYTGGTSYTMTAAHPYAGTIFGNETEVEFSSGTHSLFARVAILPNVVNNGSATTTDNTTLYLGGPPTGTAGITNIVSTFWVDGGYSRLAGLQLGYVSKSADYTVTNDDHTVEVTATAHTITLPTAVGRTGAVYTIKLTASGSGTVGTTSSQTIDASTTYSLSAQYKYVTVQSNGSNWLVIANN